MRKHTSYPIPFCHEVLFFVILFCFSAFSDSSSITPILTKHYPAASDSTIRSLYNKTLSNLGLITEVIIDTSPNSLYTKITINNNNSIPIHKNVWDIIENAELRDYKSMSVAGGLAPRFKIKYSNGITVSADKYIARIIFSDSTKANYILYNKGK